MSKKLTQQNVLDRVAAVLGNAEEMQRNFTETVELQVGLQQYNARTDKRFSGVLKLPYPARAVTKLGIFGNAEHCLWAERRGIPCFSVEKMKSMRGNRKRVKGVLKRFTSFLASQEIIRQIPRFLGPGPSRANKFPRLISGHIEQEVADAKCLVRLQVKKAMCICVPVGHVGLTADQLRRNIVLTVNFLVSLCPKGWGNIRRLYIKSTMGPAVDLLK
mmetsp:Transcript_45202/g.98063  ORF Transcript_45202/g.98063 Transcript_45202/m.98063 type:complete len:217 (+) Transcript_45202:26-676(+)